MIFGVVLKEHSFVNLPGNQEVEITFEPVYLSEKKLIQLVLLILETMQRNYELITALSVLLSKLGHVIRDTNGHMG